MQDLIPQQDDTLSSDVVADYLRKHPHFFEEHVGLVAEIFLPSPHGNGTISLTERQLSAQRDKIRMTEAALAKLIEFGEKNDQTSHKVHRFSVRLLESANIDDLSDIVSKSMQEIFVVPYVKIYLWPEQSHQKAAQKTLFSPVSDTFCTWVTSLNEPYCGAKPEAVEHELDHQLQSFACIPLQYNTIPASNDNKSAFGALVLASDDSERFHKEMGRMYLRRIGELVSAGVTKYF